MVKFSSIFLGVATAGLIVASPAIAAGLITQTRSAASLPAASVVLAPSSTALVIGGRRQSPLLVPGDSPG